MKYFITCFIFILISLCSQGQTVDTVNISVSNNEFSEQYVNGDPVFYLGTLKWYDPDILNPKFQCYLKNVETTYTMDVFSYEKTGKIYVYVSAYKKLIYPFLIQYLKVTLQATCVIADEENIYHTQLFITFLP